ncbi:AraC family transcriptional regulator [Aliiroseovarius sp. PTFE2010]|uniref:helix-turn-helix transcriptional regulator n=1 Tax=Aliiroseovarius sp. PTFE2010 TaxID=3417190 RepID=UPI003CEB2B8A
MKYVEINSDAIVGPDAAFHFTRAVLDTARPKALHHHTLYEVFWLHNGRARHYYADTREMLQEGDLVFVPPGVAHAVQGVGEEPHLVNIVVSAGVVDRIAAHGFQKRFFWGQAPHRVHRDIRRLSDLSHRAVALERAPRTALHIEAFLLALLAELDVEDPQLPQDAPDWLVRACVAARDPDVFRDGSAGLARASGKAHAHVSRTMQKYLGQTPSDYVNRIRMDHAARQLAGTGDTLAEIAAECGITNMSHFHRLFRAQFNVTPRQFRMSHQKGIVQPI